MSNSGRFYKGQIPHNKGCDKRISCICKTCGKEFKVYLSKSLGKFCSKKCQYDYPVSGETKEKMSKGHLGITTWNKEKSSGMKGRHHSEESKRKNSEAHKGKIPWNKIGDGITPLYKKIRGMPEYKEWRLQVFGRDNFTCQKCRVRGTWLEPHHIKSFISIIKENNIKSIIEAHDCLELWDLDNGITLCKKCHEKTNNYKRRNIKE